MDPFGSIGWARLVFSCYGLGTVCKILKQGDEWLSCKSAVASYKKFVADKMQLDGD